MAIKGIEEGFGRRSMKRAGIFVGGLLFLLVILFFGTKIYATSVARQKIDNAISMSRHVIDLDFDNIIQSLLSTILNASLVSMKLEYRDDSLFKRLMSEEGRIQVNKQRDLQKEIYEKLNEILTVENSEVVKETLSAFTKFMNNPGTIHAQVRPDQAIRFIRLGQYKSRPEALLKLLNLKVKAE